MLACRIVVVAQITSTPFTHAVSPPFLFAQVMPIKNAMARPSDFRSAVGISYVSITSINAVFGALVYALYGASIASNVVQNLSSGPFVKAVRALLCIDLLFTVPMVSAQACPGLQTTRTNSGVSPSHNSSYSNAITSPHDCMTP